MKHDSVIDRDVVSELIASIARKTTLSVHRLRALESELRQIYGGRAHYVSRGGESERLKLWERNDCIRAQWSAGVDPRDIALRYGFRGTRRVRQICAGYERK